VSSAVACSAAVQRCLLVCSLVPMSLHEEKLLLKRLKESISAGLMTPCPKLSRFYRKLCVRQVRAQLYVTTLLLHQFSGLLSRTTWVSQYRKGKTSLDLNEARSDEVLVCSFISLTICKQSAPCFRHITTPTPHH